MSPTNPTSLSPAALAVWDAFSSAPICAEVKLAAAIRAAANQVMYLPQTPSEYDINVQDGREEVREQLFAIADELEGANG